MPATAQQDEEAPSSSSRRLARSAPFGLVLVVVAGVVGRLAVSSPLWLDEALTVHIAERGLGGVAPALRSEAHPPLYYWLLAGWIELFGTGDGAVRSLSTVFGLAWFPLAWTLGRRIGGVPVAAWSLVLVALSPYAARYATETRMYSLVGALVLAGAIAVLAALEEPSRWRLVGVGAVTAGLVWTHYWSLYLLAVVGVAVVWRWRRSPTAGERRAAGLVALAMVVGGVTFLPWLPRFVAQVQDTGTPWAEPARPTQVLAETVTDVGSGGVDVFAESTLLGVALAVLLAVGAVARRGRGGEAVLGASLAEEVRPLLVAAAGAIVVGTAASLGTGAAFSSRYAVVVIPLLLVVAARGVASLPRRWPAGVAVVVLGLAGLYKVDTTDRTELGDVAARIADGVEAGDVVVACPDQLGVALVRGLEQADVDVPVLPYPDLDRDPRFIEWRGYEARNDAADPAAVALSLDQRSAGALWLVWNASYRTFEGDCEVLLQTLAAQRGPGAVVGEQPRERAFESADLVRFGPRP